MSLKAVKQTTTSSALNRAGCLLQACAPAEALLCQPGLPTLCLWLVSSCPSFGLGLPAVGADPGKGDPPWGRWRELQTPWVHSWKHNWEWGLLNEFWWVLVIRVSLKRQSSLDWNCAVLKMVLIYAVTSYFFKENKFSCKIDWIFHFPWYEVWGSNSLKSSVQILSISSILRQYWAISFSICISFGLVVHCFHGFSKACAL